MAARSTNRRLTRLAQQMCEPLALTPSQRSSASTAAADDPNVGLQLLTERQVKDFLVDGVLIIQVDDMPREWHEAFYAKALEISQQRGHGRWGEMPEITEVCRTPSVRGALTSILGRDYVMHPHRALHTASTGDQGFHKVRPPPGTRIARAN